MPHTDLSRIPKSIASRVDRFVSNYLRDDYVAYPDGVKVRAPKIIHCSPWGTGLYSPWEIDLMDTPLIQRLRQIRQTAGSFLTFPSSTHTRFEHTLGVIEQSARLFSAIKRREDESSSTGAKAGGLRLDESGLRNVRMAALLHDSGHGPFSHTSEEIYAYCQDMQTLTGQHGPFPNKHPHEVLAF